MENEVRMPKGDPQETAVHLTLCIAVFNAVMLALERESEEKKKEKERERKGYRDSKGRQKEIQPPLTHMVSYTRSLCPYSLSRALSLLPKHCTPPASVHTQVNGLSYTRLPASRRPPP